MIPQTLADVRNQMSGNYQPSNDDENSFMGQVSQIPGMAMNAISNFPSTLADIASQIPGAAQKIVMHPFDASSDLLGGVARGLQNIAATGGEAAQYASDNPLTRAINQHIPNFMKVFPDVNIRDELGLGQKNPNDWGKLFESNDPNQLISNTGQYGLGFGLSKGAEMPEILSKYLGKNILPMTAANSLNAMVQAPPGQQLEAGVTGAIDTALPMGAAKLIPPTFNAIKPSNLFRGTLSPEDLQANLEAAQGTQTGLGSIIGSPTLKRIQENILPHIPLSGAYTAMQDTANQFTQKGEDLMSDIGKNLPEGDKSIALQTALKKAYADATDEKNANYKKVNDLADQSGLTVNRQNFKDKANEILSKINGNPDLARELDSGFVSDIKHYANPETERLSSNALLEPSEKGLSATNILKGKLSDKANDLYSNNKTYESGLMNQLKNSLGSDIESSITNSSNPELKNAYDFAQKEYGSKFAPFEDQDIGKFIRKGGDADTMLSHFIRGGSTDRGLLLQKLTTKLPEDLQELPLHMYLSKAIDDNGRLNPPKFSTLYRNLGEKQRSALVPDPIMRQSIEKYVRGVDMNSDAFHTMYNPKTGQRNLDTAVGALEGILAYSQPIKAGAVIGAGYGANKLLTHEGLRNSLVNKMINKGK